MIMVPRERRTFRLSCTAPVVLKYARDNAEHLWRYSSGLAADVSLEGAALLLPEPIRRAPLVPARYQVRRPRRGAPAPRLAGRANFGVAPAYESGTSFTNTVKGDRRVASRASRMRASPRPAPCCSSVSKKRV